MIDPHQSLSHDGTSADGEGSTTEPSTPRRTSASHGAEAASERFRVRRFDADRTDEDLTFEEAVSSKPTGHQLLWIDIAADLTPGEAETLAGRFKFDPRTRRALQVAGDRPHIALSGGHFHLRVAAEPDDTQAVETTWLDVIAVDTTFGNLDSASFVASILDSTVTSYFNAADAIEDDVDRFDARALSDDGRREPLADLVAVRRRIARLRRVLTDHRQVFAFLAAADLAQVAGSPDSGLGFQSVAVRFEGAVAAVEASRDVLLGSFDVYMTRTAQRTNDIMKVLALATVLLLPGSLVAGLLGMNVSVPLPQDNPVSFWIVIAGVLLFIVVLLVAARLRRWL